MANDGGAAFPQHFQDHVIADGGMSLRDYFAAKAMAVFIAAANSAPGETQAIGIAGDAYDMADAMLRVRAANG